MFQFNKKPNTAIFFT